MIRRQNREVAVMLSPKEYERLRGMNIAEFEQFCEKMSKAAAKGLRVGQLIVSDDTLGELAEVLSRPKFDRYISLWDRQEFFRFYGCVVEKITVIRSVKACRDPKDDKFLELAVNGRATCIVTGDLDLLALHPFQSIPITAPARHLKTVRPSTRS